MRTFHARATLAGGAALALLLGLAAFAGDAAAQVPGYGDRGFQRDRGGYQGGSPYGTRMASPPQQGSRQPGMGPSGVRPYPGGNVTGGRPYPGDGVGGGRPGRPPYPPGPGRPPRYPVGGWGGPPAVIYDPYPYGPPRYPRAPVYYEDYAPEAPVRRPVRQAAPPRQPPPPARAATAPSPARISVPAATENRLVADEILFELAPNAQAETVLRRHRATLIDSRRFELAGVTLIRARLDGGRSARTVLGQMRGDREVRSAQPNYVYTLQQTPQPPTDEPAKAVAEAAAGGKVEALLPESAVPPAATAAEPAVSEKPASPPPVRQPQYVVEKLGLAELHQLVRGERIKVAVIDSAADLAHPELQGTVASSFDALGGEAAPHSHGTAMAAAIAAQATLQGVAPAARLLTARAFAGTAAPASASGTTFHILAALDWAVGEGARVLNLSFAGPKDAMMSRSLAAARAKGIVAVAAAGNGGPKAAALYPGADPNVIAVTATDADDKAFAGANQGRYVAIAAPGVDVIAAEPEGRYAFSSGTSIAAAHVSGVAALLLEKRPDLDLEGVRKLLTESAVDLGAKGRDPVYGAGRVDARAALTRAQPVTAARP
jgi:hypothetical protein